MCKWWLNFAPVFHSARYPIILTRNAYQSQDDARSRFRSSSPYNNTIKPFKFGHVIQKVQDRERNRDPRSSEHIVRKLIQKTHLRRNMKRIKSELFLWIVRKFDKQCRVLRTRECEHATRTPPYVCQGKLSWQHVDFSLWFEIKLGPILATFEIKIQSVTSSGAFCCVFHFWLSSAFP